MLTKILLALVALFLAACGLLWQTSSSARADVQRLRSSEQALKASLARSTRANVEHKKQLTAARDRERVAAQRLEQALAAHPEWADQPVPEGVQNAR